MKKKDLRFWWLSLMVCLWAPLLWAQVDRNALLARQEFRIGIEAFYRYGYNEAILSFEKALSYRNQEPLILEWLGRAYYQSGLEDIALQQWQEARRLYPAGSPQALLLTSRIETVRNRRIPFFAQQEQPQYVEAGRYPNKNKDLLLYRQPSSVLSTEDGSVWVVAYGSNELVRIDVNGVIRSRIRGPLNGFDRPYDMARASDGTLYVSEARGGRISVLDPQGNWKRYLGSKGRGPDQFIGPQGLALDRSDYLYVVDFGSQRISKWAPDGSFLFSFGARQGAFQGLKGPTGIAVIGDRVFVSDGPGRCIHEFDRNGNYHGILIGEGLVAPESLRATAEGQLLLVDAQKVYLIDPSMGAVREIASLGRGAGKVTCADYSVNGNLFVSLFDKEEIALLVPMVDVASGLFVEVQRVISDSFPRVTVDIKVQNRNRQPIVGLNEQNFYLYEEGKPVAQQEFRGASYLNQDTAVSVILERSPAMTRFTSDVETALRDIRKSVDRLVSVISAEEQPIKESLSGAWNPEGIARGNRARYSPAWRFDRALRLAATDLLGASPKRAVLFVGSGSVGERAFEQYSLSALAAYLANNGVAFYAILPVLGNVNPALEYLAQETGGAVLYLYRPEGIGPILQDLRRRPSGIYQLQYTSRLPTNFGNAYLPLEVEVYLLQRSGRDILGYFAPLE